MDMNEIWSSAMYLMKTGYMYMHRQRTDSLGIYEDLSIISLESHSRLSYFHCIAFVSVLSLIDYGVLSGIFCRLLQHHVTKKKWLNSRIHVQTHNV